MELRFDNGWANGGSLFDRMSGFFNELADERESEMAPPADVVEDRDGYHFSIEMPGLKSEALDVQVEDGVLIISGERKRPASSEKTRVHRSERRYGMLRRSFRLPEDAAHDTVKATYSDGVLEVTVPKRPEAKPIKIRIN